MKSTKKSLALSALSLLLCVSMLMGTTFAWFTDSVTSGKNQIIAGNLDIEVYHTSRVQTTEEKIDALTDLFKDVTLWEPGAVAYENFTIKNVGTLAAKYKLSLNVADKNTLTTDGTAHDLTEVIKVAVVKGGFTGDREAAKALTGYETLASFQETGELVANTGSDTYGVVLYWEPTDNDNLYNVNNGQTTSDGKDYLFVDFGINVVATQNTVENDSFDEKYDENATYPVLADIVDKQESYSGNFAQNKFVADSSDSTQVTAKEDIKLASDDSVTLIPKGTTLYKANGTTDDPITTTNSNADGYEGSIVSNIKTTDTTTDSVTYQISYTYKEGDTETSVSKFSKIVTNEFDVSKGLKNVAVTTVHNGGTETELTKLSTNTATDKSFYYDSENGKLYVYSSEYSEFKFTYEYDFAAAVAGQGYATLKEAIEEAKTGETVKLLKDCELIAQGNYGYEITKSFTLDLNGKNLTSGLRAGNVYGSQGDSVNMIITDSVGSGTFVKNTSSSHNIVLFKPGMVINSGKFTTSDAGSVICQQIQINTVDALTQTSLTINGGTFINDHTFDYSSGAGSVFSSDEGKTVINNGTFSTKAGQHGSVIVVDSGIDAADTVVDIYGGTFTGECMFDMYSSSTVKKSIVNVYGGTFNLEKTDYATLVCGNNEIVKGTDYEVNIYGGTFNVDPSDYVASGYTAKDNGNGTWTVNFMFAGGTGTEEDPFLIENKEQMQNITKLFELGGTANYKISDGVQTIDCDNWTSVYLNGSFDGNGVTFTNLDNTLFYCISNSDWAIIESATIQNFKISDADILANNWKSVVVRTAAATNCTFKDITVSGYVEGSIGVATFVCFGPGNFDSDYSAVSNFVFENCTSTVTTVAASGVSVGFIAHAMADSGSTITLKNSSYTGNMSATSLDSFKYVVGNWYNGSITDDNQNGTNIYNTSVNGWEYTATNKKSVLITNTGTLPDTGETFSVNKVDGATKAIVAFTVSPNAKPDSEHSDDWGCFTSTYYAEAAITESTFNSTDIKYVTVRVNPDGVSETGFHDNYYDIVEDWAGHTIGASTTVRFIQYDANGSILCITTFNFNDK